MDMGLSRPLYQGFPRGRWGGGQLAEKAKVGRGQLKSPGWGAVGGGYLIGSGGPRIFLKNINGNFEFFNITNEIKVFFYEIMVKMDKICINFKGKAS